MSASFMLSLNSVVESLILLRGSFNLNSLSPLAVTKLRPAKVIDKKFGLATPWAFGAQMTSYQRQCDVITSHRR